MKTVTFTGRRNWNIDNGSIEFDGTVDGVRVSNVISEEALADDFEDRPSSSDRVGQTDREATHAWFDRNRTDIETVARRVIIGGRVNESGGATIYGGDRRRFTEDYAGGFGDDGIVLPKP